MIIEIAGIPGWEEWRAHARTCLTQGISPANITWRQPGDAPSLLGLLEETPRINGNELEAEVASSSTSVPRAFMEAAQLAICHSQVDRFGLLYRLLWRVTRENRQLLARITDDDVMALNRLVKAIRRDTYKMKAFLRFREIQGSDGEPHYIAWYQPEHYTLELAALFFATRFRNMRWSILTPYRAVHWENECLTWADNPDPALYPADDDIEAYWLRYYASTFNPARLKPKAMLSQMPKKYWRNMPETKLIPALMAEADQRVQAMLLNEHSI